MQSGPFSRLSFTESGRMTCAVITISLIAIGTAIYLSPSSKVSAKVGGSNNDALSHLSSATPSATKASSTPSATKATKSTPKPSPTTKPTPGRTVTRTTRTTAPPRPGSTTITSKTIVVKMPGGKTMVITTTSPQARLLHCANFTWQQDAQDVYLANLSDPGALDGAIGPNNGDGIACNSLPTDAKRAVSIPYGAYVAPTPSVATKAALVNPAKKYFGIAEDGLPGDTGLFDSDAKLIGKAPSLVEWFGVWPKSVTDMSSSDASTSGAYRGDLVKSSWSRGAMPVLSWMSGNGNGLTDGSDPYECRLDEVVNGDWDTYLLKFASDVIRTNLPVTIRFDHEMNGNWYDWSAGYPQNQSSNNPCDPTLNDPSAPNLYVQAWQHMWSVFDSVGANADVIWAWTPDRVDGLTPGPAGRPTGVMRTLGETSVAEDYPGDQFVDWVGASGYAWKSPTVKWTWKRTFAQTFADLQTVAPSKPIFIAETGASQTVSPCDATTGAVTVQDATDAKANWMTDTLSGIAGYAPVVGFAYFNNNIEHVHSSCSVQVPTNWRFDSSPAALAAFQAGIQDPDYASGVMPT